MEPQEINPCPKPRLAHRLLRQHGKLKSVNVDLAVDSASCCIYIGTAPRPLELIGAFGILKPAPW